MIQDRDKVNLNIFINFIKKYDKYLQKKENSHKREENIWMKFRLW